MDRTGVICAFAINKTTLCFIKRWRGGYVATIRRYSLPRLQVTAFGETMKEAAAEAYASYKARLKEITDGVVS